jgi:hypothetical protein
VRLDGVFVPAASRACPAGAAQLVPAAAISKRPVGLGGGGVVPRGAPVDGAAPRTSAHPLGRVGHAATLRPTQAWRGPNGAPWLGTLEQLEHVAAPVPGDQLAVAALDHDRRPGLVEWLAAALADRFLWGAHAGVIDRSASRLQSASDAPRRLGGGGLVGPCLPPRRDWCANACERARVMTHGRWLWPPSGNSGLERLPVEGPRSENDPASRPKAP